MGFVVRSVIGLGAVYYAMFSPALKTGDLPRTAAYCASAANSQAALRLDQALQARLAAAGCAISFSADAQRIAASLALPPIPPPRAPAETKAVPGSLTQADLAEPWYGPDPRARKPHKRG
jgi:hypothetical protein